jgi:hypothetical protein
MCYSGVTDIMRCHRGGTMVLGAGAGVGRSVTTGGSVGGTHWGHGKRSYLTYGDTE